MSCSRGRSEDGLKEVMKTFELIHQHHLLNSSGDHLLNVQTQLGAALKIHQTENPREV